MSVSGWKLVVLLRLSPLTPFNILNYALSVTRIKFWDYTWSTALGLLPQSMLFVYMGTAVKSLSNNSLEEDSSSNFAFYIGIAMTLISTVIISIITSRAIKEELQDAEYIRNQRKILVV